MARGRDRASPVQRGRGRASSVQRGTGRATPVQRPQRVPKVSAPSLVTPTQSLVDQVTSQVMESIKDQLAVLQQPQQGGPSPKQNSLCTSKRRSTGQGPITSKRRRNEQGLDTSSESSAATSEHQSSSSSSGEESEDTDSHYVSLKHPLGRSLSDKIKSKI